MYNLNYAPTTLGVQSRREIISGGTRTKQVEYRCDRRIPMLSATFVPATPAVTRLQTYALDRTATGIGHSRHYPV
jgi:hypothetical protein